MADVAKLFILTVISEQLEEEAKKVTLINGLKKGTASLRDGLKKMKEIRER